jgi:type III secretory pathway component EscS
MASTVPARRTEKGRGHLLDLDAPRRVVKDPEKDARDLARVQKWVMSTLAVTTILHLVVGLVVAAVMLDDSPLSSQVGLTVVAGIFGVFAVAAGRAIHGRRLLSPWLLLGVVPTAVGLWLVLG